MNIRVTCPHCQGVMESKEEFLGKQARCPYCMQVVRVERSAITQEGPGPSLAPPPAPSKPRTDGKPPQAIPTSVQRTEVESTAKSAPPRGRLSASEDGPSGLIVAATGSH